VRLLSRKWVSLPVTLMCAATAVFLSRRSINNSTLVASQPNGEEKGKNITCADSVDKLQKCKFSNCTVDHKHARYDFVASNQSTVL
jgi:hypothetical protein